MRAADSLNYICATNKAGLCEIPCSRPIGSALWSAPHTSRLPEITHVGQNDNRSFTVQRDVRLGPAQNASHGPQPLVVRSQLFPDIVQSLDPLIRRPRCIIVVVQPKRLSVVWIVHSIRQILLETIVDSGNTTEEECAYNGVVDSVFVRFKGVETGEILVLPSATSTIEKGEMGSHRGTKQPRIGQGTISPCRRSLT